MNSALPFDAFASDQRDGRGRDGEETAKGTPRYLSHVPIGALVHVVGLELEADLRDWLRAVGIGEGERLTVLRRAAFGGPIHVRTSSGGEFALNRTLARCVQARCVQAQCVQAQCVQ